MKIRMKAIVYLLSVLILFTSCAGCMTVPAENEMTEEQKAKTPEELIADVQTANTILAVLVILLSVGFYLLAMNQIENDNRYDE